MTLWMGGGRGASSRVTCSTSDTSSLWLEGANKDAWKQKQQLASLILQRVRSYVTFEICEAVSDCCRLHSIQSIELADGYMYFCESMSRQLRRRCLLRRGGGGLHRQYIRMYRDSVQVAITDAATQTNEKHFEMKQV